MYRRQKDLTLPTHTLMPNLVLIGKLLLSDTLAHRACGEETTLGSLEGGIDEVRAGPCLVSKSLDAVGTLLSLNALDVGHHATLGIVTSEKVDRKTCAVETSKGNELPHEAELAEIPDVGSDLLVVHASLVPVERGREVVRHHLLGVHSLDAGSELLGLSKDRALGLHPHEVGIGGKLDGAHGGVLSTTLGGIVALEGTGLLPAPEGLKAEALGESAGIGVGKLLGLGNKALDLSFALASLTHGLSNGIVVEHALGLGLPLLLAATVVEGLNKRGDIRVGGTKNESVVSGIDVRVQVGGGLSVRSGNDNELNAHDVGLETNGLETADVLRHGDKNLATHVTALLGTGSLVLNVNTSNTSLNEHLGELHNGRETTVTSVGVSDDGAEEVNVRSLQTLLARHLSASLVLAAIMEELGLDKVLGLVGDSVHGVVSQIRTGLVGSGGSGGALPTRNVHSADVLGHLHDLDGVESTESVGSGAIFAVLAKKLPHLLCLNIREVGLLGSTTKGIHILSLVAADLALETRGGEPLLEFSDLLGTALILKGNDLLLSEANGAEFLNHFRSYLLKRPVVLVDIEICSIFTE
eukprot:Colp12_sorted_trinity150504_noHs@9148